MSSRTLSPMEILNASPLPDIGETLHVNHNNCPAGIDNKRRLYISRKREQPWAVLGFCHNCGSGGVASVVTGGTPYHLYNLTNDLKESANTYEKAEKDSQLDTMIAARDKEFCSIDLAPEYVKEYLYQYLGDADAAMAGIKWHEGACSLIYPKPLTALGDVLRGEVYFLEHQARSFIRKAPKYITHSLRNNLSRHDVDKFTDVTWLDREIEAVIVEDYLSAVKVVCNPSLDVAAVPLYGNHLAVDHLLRLSNKYKRITVWLDNDNHHIIDSAERIATTFKAVGVPEVRMVLGTKEPKHHKDKSIVDILSNGGATCLV